MIASYATGIAGFVLLSVIWIGVQSAWRNTFADAEADPDVLADRVGCHTCERAPECEHAPAGRAPAAKESP